MAILKYSDEPVPFGLIGVFGLIIGAIGFSLTGTLRCESRRIK